MTKEKEYIKHLEKELETANKKIELLENRLRVINHVATDYTIEFDKNGNEIKPPKLFDI